MVHHLQQLSAAAFAAFPDCISFRVSHTICMIGKQNAAVLPLPVSAAINTSPPPSTKGIPSA